MKRLQWITLVGVVVPALAVAVWLGCGWLSHVLSAGVRIENHSGEDLANVQIDVSVDSVVRTVRIGTLGAKEGWEHRERCPDLMIREVRFVLKGVPVVYSIQGISTPGETYVLSAQPDGSVKVAYRR